MAGVLDEYRSLRDEILQWQQKQFTAMTLTSGAIGTIMGIIAKGYVRAGWSRPGASLVFVAELLILGAAMFQSQWPGTLDSLLPTSERRSNPRWKD
jgi:hypothetical protein